MRTRAAVLRTVLAAALVTLSGIGLVLVVSGSDAVPPAEHRRAALAADGPGARALAVLHRWDRRRASAWATADARALADLYVAGSRTGASDVHELERWRSRGLRVVGLRDQVARLAVRVRAPGRLVLRVTDRTVGGVAVGGRDRLGLPISAWRSYRIALRRVDHRWRVAEVYARPEAQPAR